MQKTFAIDCFAISGQKFPQDYAVVAIDILRACTTITTAVSLGHKVLLAKTPEEAIKLADDNPNALLVGEQGGILPEGFHFQNSPVQIAKLHSEDREQSHENSPMPTLVLVSSSGVPLILSAADHQASYVCCLRNLSAVATEVTTHHQKIAIIGAGTKAEFRREDQIGCALLGQKLEQAGFAPEEQKTRKQLLKWSSEDIEKIATGNSAAYLRASQQEADLHFTLQHMDDLSIVPSLERPNEITGPVRTLVSASGNG